MKHLLSFFLFLCLPVLLIAQDKNAPFLTANTLRYLHLQQQNPKQYQEGFIYKSIAGQTCISALIEVSNPSMATQSLKTMGVHTGTKAGNIWTIQIPVDRVSLFTTTAQGITVLQLDEPVFPTMASARKTTRADSVNAGINLPKPYTGRDVIVGVIDFGFDYNHPNFYDTSGTRYRIRKVWELGTNGTPPNGYSYGNEMTDSSSIKLQGTDNAAQSHGTSTAGIAAGSGVANVSMGTYFRGMAYEADLIMVGVRRDSIANQWRSGGFSDFLDGVSYIFTQATAMGKPCVINISWGSQSGAHDGSSLFNRGCDNLTGPGKIIVMSAGNEGRENIHLEKTFTASDTVIRSVLTFTKPDYKRTWIDVWGETGKTFCGQVSLHPNSTSTAASTAYFCIGDAAQSGYILSSTGDTCYVEFLSEIPAANNKPRITMSIWNKSNDMVSIAVKGNSGTINLWNEYYYYGYQFGYQSAFASGIPGAVTGNTNSTVSDMGSGQSILLVGSYNSKIRWTDINGNGQSYITYTDSARVTPFSSHGPLTDGRIKPDILAPGLTLATSVSSYDTSVTPTGSNSSKAVSEYVHPLTGRKYYYGEFIGTSASGPAAAGIVALLLQAKPSLTPQQAKDVIFQTAIVDQFTGAVPVAGTNYAGHGKINAYGAMRKLADQLAIVEHTGLKPDCVLFPNPTTGRFVLDYKAETTELLKVEIVSMTGALLNQYEWQVQGGANQRTMDFTELPKGNYLLKVSNTKGSISIKIVLK